MGSVDFTEWAEPPLVLTLGGATYTMAPPSVEQAKTFIACAVHAEQRLGLIKGTIPDELKDLLAKVANTSVGVLGLGESVVKDLRDAGASAVTIDRMGYYAIFYWVRGKARADEIALAFWRPQSEVADSDPKASLRSRSTSGPSTA